MRTSDTTGTDCSQDTLCVCVAAYSCCRCWCYITHGVGCWGRLVQLCTRGGYSQAISGMVRDQQTGRRHRHPELIDQR